MIALRARQRAFEILVDCLLDKKLWLHQGKTHAAAELIVREKFTRHLALLKQEFPLGGNEADWRFLRDCASAIFKTALALHHEDGECFRDLYDRYDVYAQMAKEAAHG